MRLRGYLFLSVPIAVAVTQLALTACCDLTSWRGGGFGMYSDPHPKVSRYVWLVGESRDGDGEAAVRLSPLDDRLRGRRTRDSYRYAGWLKRIEQIAYRGKNFPVQLDDAAIATRIRALLAKYGDDSVIEAVFPYKDLELRLIEVYLAPDYRSVESRTLLERRLRFERRAS